MPSVNRIHTSAEKVAKLNQKSKDRSEGTWAMPFLEVLGKRLKGKTMDSAGIAAEMRAALEEYKQHLEAQGIDLAEHEANAMKGAK